MLNSDPLTFENLKVVFLPNFCMNMAEKVIPALDVGEMLSKPGTEAFRLALLDALNTMGRTVISHGVMNWSASDHWGYTNETGVMVVVKNSAFEVLN